ncbi:magnetosome protein MamC [Vibrio sonorensis]|uniref:magnetosome protein MamC n=1 Tax=Vibrio sonorensis TaxID=1004316 RepID=UPI0008DB16BF|nr:magnetosome protein MamC [Vibrio sonorensis]
MSNSTNKLSAANRAMLVGAIAGGSATIASQMVKKNEGEIDTNQLVSETAKNAVKTAAVAGATTYVAEKMAGRPVLSMLTILSVGAAGLYLMDQLTDKNDEQQ